MKENKSVSAPGRGENSSTFITKIVFLEEKQQECNLLERLGSA